MRVLDSHLHLWDPGILDYDWLEGPLAAPFGSAEHARTRLDAGEASVFVQAECVEGQFLDEVRWVEAIADAVGVRGIVAGARLDRGGSTLAHLDALATLPRVVGVRHLLQGEPDGLAATPAFLDWPHGESGWNNYNSLQQLAYFTTVFLAAPLAAVTGFRMSGMWPQRAERLSKAYPVEWARALHFPVMIYFVVFIVSHVALVMLTGFLRNLNGMYASQDAVTWTGFWVFVASLVVIAIGWTAARPLVLAPIARLFGTVSGR